MGAAEAVEERDILRAVLRATERLPADQQTGHGEIAAMLRIVERRLLKLRDANQDVR